MPEREAQAATTEMTRMGAEGPPIRAGAAMPGGDMLSFARAAAAVGATPATLEKARILAAYFRQLDDDDLRRAAVFMSGRAFGPSQRRTLGLGWTVMSKVVESISGRDADELQAIFRKHSDIGDWAGEVLEGRTDAENVSMAEVEETLEAIRTARGKAKAAPLEKLLRRLHPEAARFVVKVISGEMRIGLSEGLVEAAIAEAFGLPVTQVRRVHLITGDIGETAVRCKLGQLDTTSVSLFQPVRFMLASPVETAAEAFERMGADKVWTEEKYDGVRCQLHRADGRIELFSRDLKETTGAFPELVESAPRLGHSVLFDGEVLAHRDGKVLRFFELQHRLGRKQVTAELRREVPVVLVIFDLLHLDGRSLLDEPLETRRRLLEGLGVEHPFLLARLEEATSPADLDRIFADTRERGHEGLMVKDPRSPYTPGRRGMAWLKLKRPLATLDVVVTAVEWGHGKRKGVLSDYTFAVKDTKTGRLVNVGKAYTGLTDAEIATMTERFMAITLEDRGWARIVKTEVVLEVAFDSIQHSSRHASGYALRFPRIVRVRDDKPVDEIDTLERVEELYERYFGNKNGAELSEVAETK
ncbi:MAG TPA: ATP-dependent DNA ligase [Candidatus Dormibacteraeota bacterium]|nr:ATP-dependent DNA ligase [Candidatus Dormibacteraeota bacterium]